jgi:trk system potassium uptake protein TrkA
MKVLICGAGQVGYSIAQYLSKEDNDITVIDHNEDMIDRINNTLEVRALLGHASHPDVMEKAGAEEAELLIAVTHSDEVNIVACQMAHSLFAIPRKIARLRAQSYLIPAFSHIYRGTDVPIDVIISPEKEVAHAISEFLSVPGAFEVEMLAESQVAFLGIICEANAPILHVPFRQMASLFPDLHLRIVAIQRGGRFFVPHGDHQLLPQDQAYVVTATHALRRVLKLFDHEAPEARRLVIAGAGNVCRFLVQKIKNDHPQMDPKVIEWNRDVAEDFARSFPDTSVFNGDALDQEILHEADIGKADTYIAITDDDEANILSSLLARRLGSSKSLALVNSLSYEPLISSLGIDSVVNPRAITVSKILQYVRRGHIHKIHSIGQGFGEIIEADALEKSDLVGKRLQDVYLPRDTLLAAIVRQHHVIVPNRQTQIMAGDRLIMFVPKGGIRAVEHALAAKTSYF